MRGSIGLLLVALLFYRAAPLIAQCADGTPPPCSRPAAQRVDPALSDQTWIVLPFDNVSRRTDTQWIADGSVNLLNAELVGWSDIQMVHERRVDDLVRSILGAARGPKISLDEALRVARRSGAGRLVLGDVVSVGRVTRLSATLVNVRSGAAVRVSRVEAASPDSVLSAFNHLAAELVGVPATSAGASAIGTRSIEAAQAYVQGAAALNRFDLATARRQLDRALALDSTFALAHYELAWLMDWEPERVEAERRAHAAAAVRLGSQLPPRQRALAEALSAMLQGNYSQAGQLYGRLVAADSTDVEAVYGLGESAYHDPTVERVPGDTTHLRFRTSWNDALLHFRQALVMDPSFHVAFRHILDILTSSHRTATDPDSTVRAAPSPMPGAPTSLPAVSAFVLRNADTLVTIPLRFPLAGIRSLPSAAQAMVVANRTRDFALQSDEYRRTNSAQLNLEQASLIAQRWVDASPTSGPARAALGHTLLRLGRPADANFHLSKASAVNPPDLQSLIKDRVEASVKIDHGAAAAALMDSLRRASPMDYDVIIRVTMGGVAALIGRPSDYARVALRRNPRETMSEPDWRARITYIEAAFRALIGVASDTLGRIEDAYVKAGEPGSPKFVPLQMRLPTLVWSLRSPRAWPTLQDWSGDAMRLTAAVGRGDIEAVRRLAQAMDSSLANPKPESAPLETTMLIAEAYLYLADSSNALRLLRRTLDTSLVSLDLFGRPVVNTTLLPLIMPPVATELPRMMLLRADLEMAKGNGAVARNWYRRFAELWSFCEPELAPTVEQARRR